MAKKSAPRPKPSKPAPDVVRVETPVNDSLSQIRIVATITGTEAQVSRARENVEITQLIINGPEFKERVLSSTYKNYYAKASDVWAKILAGAELGIAANGQWDLDLRFAVHSSCTNLGWTYTNSLPIYFNTRKCDGQSKWDGRKDSGIVGTICHETAHKFGYGHKYASSSQSVPYSLGTICANLYSKYKKIYDDIKAKLAAEVQAPFAPAY